MSAANVRDFEFEKQYRTLFGDMARPGPDPADEPKSTVVTQTLEVLTPFIQELWRTPSRDAMLTTRSADGIDSHMSLSSPETVEYLCYRHYQKTRKPISEATQKAVGWAAFRQSALRG